MKIILGKRTLVNKIVVLEYDEGGGYLPLSIYDIPNPVQEHDTIGQLFQKMSDVVYPIMIDESLEKSNIEYPADIYVAVEMFKQRV